MEHEWKSDSFGGSYREIGDHFCGCVFQGEEVNWYYAVFRDPTGLWVQEAHATEGDAKGAVERRCHHEA